MTEMERDIPMFMSTCAGPDTEIHKRRGMYIDIVRRGVPFPRQSPVFHRSPS